MPFHSATAAGNAAPKWVIVGVDIGMTCTGVAICSPDKTEPGRSIKPVIIQKWLGNTMLENKVPTRLAYKAGNTRPHSWGFGCPSLEDVGPAMAVKELFKFYLDKPNLVDSFKKNPEAAPGTSRDVITWYTDFLTALYSHIVTHLKAPPWNVDWNSAKVEFIFSLPTSWKGKDKLVEDFEDIVKEAGFGSEGNCSAVMGLTEGEAAAVSTAMSLEHKYKRGDTILVCDAGGGTTDICVLRVNRIEGETVDLTLLDDPRVLGVGSLDIDDTFEKNTALYLSDLEARLPQSSEHIAHQMTRNQFQAIKTSFGTPAGLPIVRIPVPGLPVDSDERVELSRDKLTAMFDEQIDKIFKFIEKEIEYLKWDQPRTEISYLVLSGGLGSSRYVQTQFTKEYSDRGIKVLFAKETEEPPLAVCKGLVIDRMQRICHNASVFRTRRFRSSYGILYSERYDKSKHSGQKSIKNSLDGHKYAENQIDWIIRRGDEISEDETISRKYSRIVSPPNNHSSNNNANTTWRDGVVTSDLPPASLPPSLHSPGAQVICYIVSDLGPSPDPDTTAGITQRRKSSISWKKFLQVDYDLLVYTEPDSLRFAIMVGGEPRNEPHAVRVQWINTPEEAGSADGSREEGSESQSGFFVGL
ncbi:MAG: hypothetical protein M1840_005873 [Geoglossum simile]|nr:MAG: hypothetical protein M1840_005873 [Geoglossum simile]